MEESQYPEPKFLGEKMTDFERNLFLKRQVKDLNFKIGVMQSEIDELNYELKKASENNSKGAVGKMLESSQKSNAEKKIKIKELKTDLQRYIRAYGKLSK